MWYATVVVALLYVSTVFALPQIPEGVSPEEYYGGFYPTEEWLMDLETIPRDARNNPFQTITVVEERPPGKSWPGAEIVLTEDDVEEMKEEMAVYLGVPVENFLGMVPRRNRIAGNARVMPTSIRKMPRCPTGDGGRLVWTPDRPDELRCEKGHVVDPFEFYPPTGSFEITGPMGETQEYVYHDEPDGTRWYVEGEFIIAAKTASLGAAAKKLGILYNLTRNEEYARRAAAIIYDFARAVPHWPKIHRGRPGVHGIDRFRPVDECITYAGIWYDKFHTGSRTQPESLALAYDFVVNADVWGEFDDRENGSARDTIETDLFMYTVRDAIRYDVKFDRPPQALSNYIPYQIDAFCAIGRGVGIPELVHYGNWKLTQLAEKTLMADGTFPESPSYARQHVYGMAKAALMGAGHTDPEGFVSTIDGRHFEDLDMREDIPHLRRAITALETMIYPGGSHMMVHDTWSLLVSSGMPPPDRSRPLFYPCFGNASLSRGYADRENQIMANLHYSGNWGHDHKDMLDFILWAYRGELISDIGYAHTYRQFADWSLGHNLVVVDRIYQERVQDHGILDGWYPVEDGVQVVEAHANDVYPQCDEYRRALFLVPLGDLNNVVVDVFTVRGGDTHEWMAQGSCMKDQHMEVSVPTEFFAESYADNGEPFEPVAHNEYVDQRIEKGLPPHHVAEGEKNPWYGVFRDVHRGHMGAPMTATYTTDDGSLYPLHVHLLAPDETDVYTCTVPSLRRCWNPAVGGEDHSLVEKYRMPKLVLRRDGDDLQSRFVAVWEPTRGEGRVIESIENLAPENEDIVALRMTERGDPARVAEVFYQPHPNGPVQVTDDISMHGRYAAVVSDGDKKTFYLYDCESFTYAQMDVIIPDRPALDVLRTDTIDGEHVIVLEGTWEDVPEEGISYDTPVQVSLMIDDGQRVFPIRRITADGDETIVHCTRDPGFIYDAEKGVLEDTFSPWITYEGEATLSLPSKTIIRHDAGVVETSSTDAFTINGEKVSPSSD